MPIIQKLKVLNKKKRLLTLASIFALLVMFGAPALGTTYAANGNDTADTVKYCKNKLPKNLDKLCTTGNMNRLRNAFKDGCNNKDACMENKAENAIDQMAKKNPKNEKDFNDALDAAVKGGAGGGDGGVKGGGDACAGSACDATPTGQGQNCTSNHCDLVALYVNPTIRILSIVVGLVVAASLVMGGIQYASSAGDAQKAAAAKSRISNTLLAFVAYAFMYAFLNFLIPGGLFH